MRPWLLVRRWWRARSGLVGVGVPFDKWKQPPRRVQAAVGSDCSSRPGGVSLFHHSLAQSFIHLGHACCTEVLGHSGVQSGFSLWWPPWGDKPEYTGKGLHELLGPLESSLPQPRVVWEAPAGTWRWLAGGDGTASLWRPCLPQNLIWGLPAGHQVPGPLSPPDQAVHQGGNRGCFAEYAVRPLSTATPVSQPFLGIHGGRMGAEQADPVPAVTGLQSLLQAGFHEPRLPKCLLEAVGRQRLGQGRLWGS